MLSVHGDAVKARVLWSGTSLYTYCPVHLEPGSKSVRAGHGMRLRPASSLHCSRRLHSLSSQCQGATSPRKKKTTKSPNCKAVHGKLVSAAGRNLPTAAPGEAATAYQILMHAVAFAWKRVPYLQARALLAWSFDPPAT